MLTDILGALATGGLSGLIGGVANKFADYKLEKLRLNHELQTNEHELKVIQAEADFNMKIAEVKGKVSVAVSENEMEADIAKAEAQAMKASFESDRRTYSTDGNSKWFVFVDVWRGIIRPLLTTFYSLVSVYLTYVLFEVYGGSFTVEKAAEYFHMLVVLIVYMTATSTLFWFASRTKAPKGLF